MYLDKVA